MILHYLGTHKSQYTNLLIQECAVAEKRPAGTKLAGGSGAKAARNELNAISRADMESAILGGTVSWLLQ